MTRLPRVCLPGIPLHLIQRGNNRQACFASQDNFAVYASWLQEYAARYRVDVHAWVFMTNHVHLLVTPYTASGVSKMMQSLGQRYVRYFNHTYRRTGTLWEGRYKSCVVDAENYLLACQRYIELNPVRAGMVESQADYIWSSYQANGLGKDIGIHTPHPVYLRLGHDAPVRERAYRDLLKVHVDIHDDVMIREATNKGLSVGSERFKQKIERLSGLRVTEKRKGPKPKNK